MLRHRLFALASTLSILIAFGIPGKHRALAQKATAIFDPTGYSKNARPASIIGSCPASGSADIFTLNGKAFSKKNDFHRAIAASMKFPDYYGDNLDALEEILGDKFLDRQVILFWNGHEVYRPLYLSYYNDIIKLLRNFSAKTLGKFCVILN